MSPLQCFTDDNSSNGHCDWFDHNIGKSQNVITRNLDGSYLGMVTSGFPNMYLFFDCFNCYCFLLFF